LPYRLTRAADKQVEVILRESRRRHGVDAANRYRLLILTVVARLGNDPNLPGWIDVPDVPGIRAYPLELSRMRIEPAQRVGRPRHLVFYRVVSDTLVEILGLAHERMVLSRAARKAVRNAEKG